LAQPLVLAIEPDLRQAAIVKRIVREKVMADVAVVDSRDAAIEAMRTYMPDVLLLSALLSPRDEDELIAHLKTLENAGHLQTHTIPQLASSLEPEERASRGLLSAFRRKKDPGRAEGCDPNLFADEIRVFLQRAADKKRELQDSDRAAPDMRPDPVGAAKAAATPDDEAPAPQGSSWSSPFEWKPSASSSRGNPKPPVASPEPVVARPEPVAARPEPVVASPEPDAARPEPVVARPEPVVASPEPVVAHPEPGVASPELVAARPEPVTSGPPVVASPEPPIPVAVARPVRPSTKDSGLGIRDRRLRLRDEGSSQLGLWMRRESDDRADGEVSAADVRTLLSTLGVPVAVASVSYPRGCRIRRVRVPAVQDESSDAAGAVIAGRQATADNRDRRHSA
jgi:hypothetical protein